MTGGAGFIGSNLCEAILGMGHRVRCLDDPSTGKRENVDLFIDHPNYELLQGDIKRSNADISKARCLLGYAPQWDFQRGIAVAIEWYRENL